MYIRIFGLILLFTGLVTKTGLSSSLLIHVEDCSKSEAEGGGSLFGEGAAYQNVYDTIIYYPQYQKVMKYHMGALNNLPKNALVVEAGGGTGNMTRRAMDLRPDARVYMSDFNPEMADHSIAKGISPSQLSLGPDRGDIQSLHLGGRKALDGEVDLVFSHSVLWNIKKQENFFREAARVLKKGGILSVSTFKTGVEEIGPYFVKSIEDGFKEPLKNNLISAENAKIFTDQNARVVDLMGTPENLFKSSLNEEDIHAYANMFGFEVIDVGDSYVVDTPDGPQSFFIQFQLRRL